MPLNHRRFAVRIVPVAFGFAALGIGYGAVQAIPAFANASSPVRCEIEASNTGRVIALSGVFHSAAPASGSYQLRVVSAGGSGSTNIRQGGGFSAGAGATRLGQVTLGNPGAVYDASLKVTVAGQTYACTERVGGAT